MTASTSNYLLGEGDDIYGGGGYVVHGDQGNAITFGSDFTNKAGQLISVFTVGPYEVQGDGGCHGYADFLINVVWSNPLSATDFIL